MEYHKLKKGINNTNTICLKVFSEISAYSLENKEIRQVKHQLMTLQVM